MKIKSAFQIAQRVKVQQLLRFTSQSKKGSCKKLLEVLRLLIRK